MEGLLQRLASTADMAAVALLQAHHLDIGSCQLPDSRTLLHLLVSPRFYTSGNGNEKQVKEWQDQIAPLLRQLLSSPGAALRHDCNNKTPMDICLPEYKQFRSAMNNARLSAQPVASSREATVGQARRSMLSAWISALQWSSYPVVIFVFAGHAQVACTNSALSVVEQPLK